MHRIGHKVKDVYKPYSDLRFHMVGQLLLSIQRIAPVPFLVDVIVAIVVVEIFFVRFLYVGTIGIDRVVILADKFFEFL